MLDASGEELIGFRSAQCVRYCHLQKEKVCYLARIGSMAVPGTAQQPGSRLSISARWYQCTVLLDVVPKNPVLIRNITLQNLSKIVWHTTWIITCTFLQQELLKQSGYAMSHANSANSTICEEMSCVSLLLWWLTEMWDSMSSRLLISEFIYKVTEKKWHCEITCLPQA